MYLVIFAIALVGFFIWYWRVWLHEPADAPPIVKLYGTRYSAFWLTCTDPARLIKEAHEKYGPIFTLDLIFLKHTIITDADGFAFVYKAKEATLSFYTVIKYLKGMLGDESTKDRPVHEHIERADKVQMTLMKNKKTFYSYIQEEVEEWAAELAARGEPFDFVAEADRLLMRINIHCFVGKEVRKQYADTFIKLYDELEEKGMAIGTFFFYWLPFGTGARCRAIRKEIESILEPIIDERRRRYAETGEEQVDYLNDYITQPHKKTKEPWTRTEMVERTLAIFFAARINTMKTLFWTMMSLSVRPQVVEKLRTFLDEKDISFEMIERDLDYVDQVMRETVRPMFGINPGARVSMDAIPYKGYVIPKGYVVGASAYVVNRDPKYYPEPEKFIPERWEHGTELRNNVNIWAFFGMGQHRCRGEKFAHLLVRTALATVFKKYDFKWLDMKEEGQLPPYKFTVALPTPLVPIRATLTPREV